MRLQTPLRNLENLREHLLSFGNLGAPQTTGETLRDHDMTVDRLRESQRCTKNSEEPWCTLAKLNLGGNLSEPSAKVSEPRWA